MALPAKPTVPMLVALVKGNTGVYFSECELPTPKELFEICKATGLEQFIDQPSSADGIYLVGTLKDFQVYYSERGRHFATQRFDSLEPAVLAKINLIYQSLNK